MVWAVNVSFAMLAHRRLRLLSSVAAIGFSFFLAVGQLGVMMGWINTVSYPIRAANADLWVLGRGTIAFDYGIPIPEQTRYVAASVPGVAWVNGMIMDWVMWQCPSGVVVSAELIGLDHRGQWRPPGMVEGSLEDIALEDSVAIDELYLGVLDIEDTTQSAEIFGREARVRGITRGIRTFTASPFILTSIDNARRYTERIREDELTFVQVKVSESSQREPVKEGLATLLPRQEVLTEEEFINRTVTYWMLETGVGLTIVLAAAMGFAIGGIVASQTLYATTQEHLESYTTLLAVGVGRGKLGGMIAAQGIALGCLGIAAGSGMYWAAARALARSPVPMEASGEIFVAVIGVYLFVCMLASFSAATAVFRLEPQAVFAAHA